MPLIEFEGVDGTVEAWLAQPEELAQNDPIRPGVLFYMDAIGLRQRLWDMADTMASWGYTVLVPNIFYRSGSAADTSPDTDLRAPGARESFFKEAGPRMEALTSELSRADTCVYLEKLRELSGSTTVAAIGYCMGVRLAMRAAGDHPEVVSAVAGFHGGGLVTDGKDSPHLSLETARAAIMLRHADGDASMPIDAMDTITQACQRHSVELSQDIYPNAPHGYSMADTSMYDEGAAEKHFQELQQFLDSRLRQSSMVR